MKILFTTIIAILFSNLLIGQQDIIPTDKGDVKLTPIFHSTTVLEWDNLTIYMDPYGGANRFTPFSNADIICITHAHGDHLNKETLSNLDISATTLIAPQSVTDELGDLAFKKVIILKNDEDVSIEGINIKAFPMYNLPNDESARHKKGWGNAYILTIGGKTFYFSGDTADIPEMRSLKDIDYAFICMNLPYTMDVNAAADAVVEFSPKVVYPFHFRGSEGFSDIALFKKLVNDGNTSVEVRIRDWYPEN